MPIDPLGFIIMALAVIAVPGPAVAHVLLSTAIGGLRLAGFAIMGILTGHCIAMGVSFSLGYLMLGNPETVTAVQLTAASLLTFLGLRLLRAAVWRPTPRRPRTGPAWWRISGGLGAVAGGLVVALANPLSLGFFASAAIGFLDPALPPWPQSGVLALLYLGSAMLVHGSYAVFATWLHGSAITEAARAQRALQVVAAAVMLGTAGLIALRAAGYI
jgi:threonine/homoserine/homoserine lactone efflux protein